MGDGNQILNGLPNRICKSLVVEGNTTSQKECIDAAAAKLLDATRTFCMPAAGQPDQVVSCFIDEVDQWAGATNGLSRSSLWKYVKVGENGVPFKPNVDLIYSDSLFAIVNEEAWKMTKAFLPTMTSQAFLTIKVGSPPEDRACTTDDMKLQYLWEKLISALASKKPEDAKFKYGDKEYTLAQVLASDDYSTIKEKLETYSLFLKSQLLTVAGIEMEAVKAVTFDPRSEEKMALAISTALDPQVRNYHNTISQLMKGGLDFEKARAVEFKIPDGKDDKGNPKEKAMTLGESFVATGKAPSGLAEVKQATAELIYEIAEQATAKKVGIPDPVSRFRFEGIVSADITNTEGPAANSLFGAAKIMYALDRAAARSEGKEGMTIGAEVKGVFNGQSGALYASDEPWIPNDQADSSRSFVLLGAKGSLSLGIEKLRVDLDLGEVDIRNRVGFGATDRDYQGPIDMQNFASRALGGTITAKYPLSEKWAIGAKAQAGRPINEAITAGDFYAEDKDGQRVMGGKVFGDYENKDGLVSAAHLEIGSVDGQNKLDGKFNTSILGAIMLSPTKWFYVGTEDYGQSTELGSRFGLSVMLGAKVEKLWGTGMSLNFPVYFCRASGKKVFSMGSENGTSQIQVFGQNGLVEQDVTYYDNFSSALVKPTLTYKFSEQLALEFSPFLILGSAQYSGDSMGAGKLLFPGETYDSSKPEKFMAYGASAALTVSAW